MIAGEIERDKQKLKSRCQARKKNFVVSLLILNYWM